MRASCKCLSLPFNCKIKTQCTTGVERRISRWEHEAVLDDMENRLNQAPEMMKARRETDLCWCRYLIILNNKRPLKTHFIVTLLLSEQMGTCQPADNYFITEWTEARYN